MQKSEYKKGNNGNPIGYLNQKICKFYGKNIIKLVISKMSKSQIDSNTDFVEQSNILDLLQQRQTLKGQFRFQFSRNKISIETRKELVQYLDFIVSIMY